jgi:hypothetical protein
MPNMSYCRFENTSNDLLDCTDAMEEAHDMADLDLSSNEQHSMRYMKTLCEKFLEEYDRLMAHETVDFGE